MMAAPISKRAVTHGPLRALSPASYTANGERVEEGAHRSNLRQIAEDARIAGQSAVGQTADHDIAGKEPKAGGQSPWWRAPQLDSRPRRTVPSVLDYHAKTRR
jgi:hypothetical protein